MPALPKRSPARRNRSATAATLTRPKGRIKVPDLPPAGERDWHPLTMAWWRDVWRSPMAPEYDDSDVHGLYLLAALVNDFWWKPSKEIAAEIRLHRQCFGLSPIDRRRLQWEIERTEDAQERGAKRRARTKQDPAAGTGDDPRAALRLA